ncbi:MAG: zinc-dependent alcohol dehydrogenase family protein [Arenicellales bacterium]|nr:zinc-dependent alcohol dehydrogenase family protein [Arenicellales bacterium]
MVLKELAPIVQDSEPLDLDEVSIPEPKSGEIRLKVSACGVCHTELDEIEGRTPPPRLPIILGHEVVGRVDKLGSGSTRFQLGDRVGVGWIHSSSGTKNENVDDSFVATGRDVNGGYAEYMTVPDAYAYPIPGLFSDEQAAPLLCAGGIGYRALKLTGVQDRQRLGLTGFGGSAHLVLQLARHLYPNIEIYVFARDQESCDFALSLGATWAGDTSHRAPHLLDAVIDTTPAWKPVVDALPNLRPGGRLVINAIRKEDQDKDYLTNIEYATHLWLEKEIKTVANITHDDIAEFLPIAAEVPIRAEVQTYKLEQANQALRELKAGRIRGAKVLQLTET